MTFTLKDAPGNAILLTVVESGFDQVPPQRRRLAFEMNSGGWEAQLQNIARYASRLAHRVKLGRRRGGSATATRWPTYLPRSATRRG